jgi:dTDP-4-dehydrorhamnose reductase
MGKNFTGIQIAMSFKLLLTDVISPLGKALEHELEREPFKLLTPGPDELNWADPNSLANYFLKHQPELVLNCRGCPHLWRCQYPPDSIFQLQRIRWRS